MKRLFYRLLTFVLLFTSASLGWKFRGPILHFYQKHITSTLSPRKKLQPQPELYQKIINQLAEEKTHLASRYAQARSAQEISAIISESCLILEETLPQMMRCWLGTPWDFNGTCQTPGSGEIACGYFVSTILRDAGFRVERFRLAQQPSQNIIGTFLPRKEMHITAGQPYSEFISETTARGPGIKIVGLDKHVAFLVIPSTLPASPRFIHSSGGTPKCVVDEDRENATALRNSRYRVVGNLTRNDQVIHRWLTGQAWPTKL